jgi:hypothetical protein
VAPPSAGRGEASKRGAGGSENTNDNCGMRIAEKKENEMQAQKDKPQIFISRKDATGDKKGLILSWVRS